MRHKKGHMGMGTGRMKPQKPTPPASPTNINNPIVLLSSFPALAETSIVDQDTTVLSISGSHLSAFLDISNSNFTLLVNILIYAPNAALDAMAVFDTVPAESDGTPASSRLYRLLFQNGFGKNQNAYQHGMFYLNGTSPLSGQLDLTVKHPPCKRRIITIDQFANLIPGIAEDQRALKSSQNQGTIQVTSGLTQTTTSPFQLVYGAVAIGRDFDQYSDPDGFIPIQSVGSNIDSFDATLKTYYQLTSTTGQYGLSALISSHSQATNFVWGAAVQTFKALVLK